MKTRRILSAILAAVMLLSILTTGMTASAALPYTDVAEDSWSYEGIKYVTDNGLMNGTGGTSFSPTVALTRAMVVTVLYRMEGSPRVSFKGLFIDVPDRQFYSEAVEWAKAKGIVNATGYDDWGDEYFSPDRDITRQELATMFVRFADYKYINTKTDATLDNFDDKAQVASWAADAMRWATDVGLIQGTGNGKTLSPTGKATREQFATIMFRFCEKIEFEYLHNLSEPKPLNKYVEPKAELIEDADIYVAVDGNDTTGDGSFSKPYATFAKARDAVRELLKTAEDEIVVAFKAGNYGKLDNLTFSAEDGGSEKVPVTYCAYGDGPVQFQNGVVIKEEDFKPLDEAEKSMFKKEAVPYIYKADLKGQVDKFDFSTRLFTETGLATEAREPENTYYANVTTTHDPLASIQLQNYLPGIVEKFSTWEGVKVTGFLRRGWLVDTFPVLSYDEENAILTFDFENAPFENGYPLDDDYCLMFEGRTDDLIFFSNLPEFLTVDNEYWFDNKTSTLYVYDAKGDYAIDAGAGTFITVESGAEYISLVGMEFNATADTAIKVNANHFTIDRCKIGNVGGRAAIHGDHITNFTAKNNELYNFVDTGIYLDVYKNTKTVRELVPAGTLIVNNYLHDFTLPQYFSSGIEITRDVGGRIANNYFYQGGHGGIRYNECIDLIIEYNVFDQIMTKTQDFGAVYTWNSVTYRDNHIRYNIFKYCHVIAIYLDDNTCGQHVYGNVFYESSSIVQNGGRENFIHDNVLLGNGVTSNPGRYSYIADNEPEKFTDGDAFYDRFMSQKPKEGEEMYATWYERWPELYHYNIDPTKVGEKECLFTTYTNLENNVAFGSKVHDEEMIKMFGDDINNRSYSVNENPFFVNPAAGDYSVIPGSGLADNHFAKIGRVYYE